MRCLRKEIKYSTYKAKGMKDLDKASFIFFQYEILLAYECNKLALCSGVLAHMGVCAHINVRVHRHTHTPVSGSITTQRSKLTEKELSEDVFCSYILLNKASRLRSHCFQHVFVITSLCHSAYYF